MLGSDWQFEFTRRQNW